LRIASSKLNIDRAIHWFGTGLDDRTLKRSVLCALALGWLLYATVFASTGIFTIDEMIYGSMIERFARHGDVVIPNGYADHGSSSLRLKVLVPGPHGLVPQYPTGYAILAAPFFLVGGLRAVILLNALASVGILVLTYVLGRKLFNDLDLALNAALIVGLASFAFEYALGIWPHALGAFFVILAACLAAASVQERRTAAYAVLAGLVLGLGVNIRVDVILAAPAIALWLLGNSKHTNGALPFMAGLVPGFGVASWLNYLKLGLATPFTYGDALAEAHDLVSVNNYGELLPLALFGSAVAIAFAFRRFRAFFVGWWAMFLGAAVLALAMTIPDIKEPTLKILRGLYVLLVDLQSYDHIERQSGVVRTDEGWLTFWGVIKKSLVVSLPFLGILPLSLMKIFRPGDRASYSLCLLCAMSLFAFFALNQWHGGFSHNMRYFLPALPFLALLTADAWREIGPARVPWHPAFLAAGIVALPVVTFALATSGRTLPTAAAMALSRASLLVFGASLLLSAMYLSVRQWRSQLKQALHFTTMVGFAAALAWGYFVDTARSQVSRSARQQISQSFSAIEGNALVISLGVGPFYFHLQREGAVLSMISGREDVDVDLVEAALRAKRPIYIYPELAAEEVIAALGPGYVAEPVQRLPAGLCRLERSTGPGAGRSSPG
jgi:4-amino-4-deoxy-L-arabinose transferase-like glycosyltransferase